MVHDICCTVKAINLLFIFVSESEFTLWVWPTRREIGRSPALGASAVLRTRTQELQKHLEYHALGWLPLHTKQMHNW